jgi:formamidopyrimidine-DNA glycosylase
MPELPEVETVVRQLRDILTGETIAKVRVTAPPSSTVVSPSLAPKTFDRVLRGKRVLAVERRGKNILIRLSGRLTLWVHLKMTGHFFWLERTAPVDKHDLVVFDLKSSLNGAGNHLRFNDYRRFGRLRVYRDDELFAQKGLADLGPEPLEISANEFVARCRRRPRMLKPALLDQSFLAGIGNIYADESLYASRLHPKRLTTSVSRPKLIELHGHIQRLLRKSIRLMGTTVDTYSGVNGQVGDFQNYLLVYDREGEPCDRCGARVVREKIGSRSAHYCPRCQRPPRGVG